MMHPNLNDPNWWHRRTALEKALTIFSLACLLAVIVSLVSFVCVISHDNNNNNQSNQKNPDISNTKDKICFTPSCIHAASEIIQRMDMTVNPCNDFHNFACGNFIKENIIPDDKNEVSITTIIEDKLKTQLKNILSESIEENEAEPFKLTKKFYNSCMNKTLIEERGTQPVIDILESFGGWPVVKGDSWDKSKWTWAKAIKDFRKYGYSTDQILRTSVESNLINSTRKIIEIDQADLGLSREYLIKGMNDTTVQAYLSYMVDIAVLHGANKDKALKEMQESLDFEFALANISLPQEEQRDSTLLHNPFTIKELQDKYPYVQWLEYITAILPKDVKVDQNEIINVRVPKFFDRLGKVLQKTPKRTIANYMTWRIAVFSIKFLGDTFQQRESQYLAILSGTLELEPRWKQCVDTITNSFSISISALYVRNHFKEDSKVVALEMVNNIKVELKEILMTVPWMDEITRNAALLKLEKIKAHIGYPDELMDDKNIIDYYKLAKVDENKYLESALHLNFLEDDRQFKKLYLPVNKTDWREHSFITAVNAFYSENDNFIEFTAGILQGQFFNVDWPKYLNYGSTGAVIGHELCHGFDDEGRQYDFEGNLVDWWQEETKSSFLAKAKCIIEQYGNFTEKTVNLTLNGINTQGENIADIGGTKNAYLAYMKWVKENGDEPGLPGLNYSPKQLFWLSFAQSWCSVTRPEFKKLLLTTDSHSLDQFRVLGTLSNLAEFSTDFDCPKGSTMNPFEKCEMW